MVSVIMLTYNRKAIMTNMVNDILNQTYKDFEFIIVDNGSDDGTDKILKECSRLDHRIKVISIPKSSIGKARNAGLRKSVGNYIAYVDDDDRADTDYLNFLIELIRENDADISMCGASQGDGTTREPQCLFEEKLIVDGVEAAKLLLGRKYIRNGTATKLYKREILEQFPFVENYRNEDLHTQYKYLLASRVVALHGMDKYYCSRHANNVSSFTSDSSKWDARTIQDYLEAYHNRTEYINSKAPELSQYAQYCEWSFMISMVNKIISYQLLDCELLLRKLTSELLMHKKDFLENKETQEFERRWINDYIKDPA